MEPGKSQTRHLMERLDDLFEKTLEEHNLDKTP